MGIITKATLLSGVQWELILDRLSPVNATIGGYYSRKDANGNFIDVTSSGSGSSAGHSVSQSTAHVNSVNDFVNSINTALTGASFGIDKLASFSDDIENMLNGTEFLADGTTPNPFYDVTNPGVLKEASIVNGLTALQTAIQTSITNVQAAVQTDVSAVQAVVDANSTILTDAGFGLSPLKTLIDTLTTDLGTSTASITNVLSDATNGLVVINDTITTRFNTIDSSLATVDTVMSNAGSQSYNVYI